MTSFGCRSKKATKKPKPRKEFLPLYLQGAKKKPLGRCDNKQQGPA
jgi:hypothetical protein